MEVNRIIMYCFCRNAKNLLQFLQKFHITKLEASAGSAGVKLHHLWPLKNADGCGTLQSGITASFSWDTFYRKINSSGLLKDIFTTSGNE